MIPELRSLPADGKDDPWVGFCFIVIRTLPQQDDKDITFKVVIKSPYLLKACKDVIQEIAGLSWNAIPLEVFPSFDSTYSTFLSNSFQLDPQLLLSFLPNFETYQNDLKAKANTAEEYDCIVSSVDVLVEYLRKDYRQTIASIDNLTSHGEITFDLLHAVMVPRSTVVTRCPVTGELRALQLVSATPAGSWYNLICEGIDADNSEDSNTGGFVRTQSRILLRKFDGTVKITSLDVYPINYHPQAAEIMRSMITRGRKWSKLVGVHHMSYNGAAGYRHKDKVVKYNVHFTVPLVVMFLT